MRGADFLTCSVTAGGPRSHTLSLIPAYGLFRHLPAVRCARSWITSAHLTASCRLT
ncbi:hypothetical protein GA0115261_112892 [Streptomyces sp. OspMP-M43]|nr:hypothetical protein GA0115261_112892 [Streptomyces sp. OspMP-M43]